MQQGPFLNQFGMHISSLSIGGGELYRTNSQLKLDKHKLSRMNIANSLKAQQTVHSFSFLSGTCNGLSIVPGPRLYYKPIVCRSRFGWPNFSVSANGSRYYSHFPKSQPYKKDDVLFKEKRETIGVLGTKGNFNSNRKLPKALAARSEKSADDLASNSRDNETIAEIQQPSAKQDDKAQGQRELSRRKKNTKKQKTTASAVDKDSLLKGSGIKSPSRISSSEPELEVSRFLLMTESLSCMNWMRMEYISLFLCS